MPICLASPVRAQGGLLSSNLHTFNLSASCSDMTPELHSRQGPAAEAGACHMRPEHAAVRCDQVASYSYSSLQGSHHLQPSLTDTILGVDISVLSPAYSQPETKAHRSAPLAAKSSSSRLSRTASGSSGYHTPGEDLPASTSRAKAATHTLQQ